MMKKIMLYVNIRIKKLRYKNLNVIVDIKLCKVKYIEFYYI